MQISARVRAIQPSMTLAVSAKAKAMKAQGIDVVGFGAGEPDFKTPPHICEAAHQAIRDGHHGYVVPSSGLADLKAANTLATCLYCRTDLAPEQIEALRAGLVRLSETAGRWAVRHGGASPVRLTAAVGDQRMLLKFTPIAESGNAFLAEHLDAEAAVPAALTDAGMIDSLAAVNGEVVLEKILPPPPQLPEEEV